jgi:hypothetical protein
LYSERSKTCDAQGYRQIAGSLAGKGTTQSQVVGQRWRQGEGWFKYVFCPIYKVAGAKTPFYLSCRRAKQINKQLINSKIKPFYRKCAFSSKPPDFLSVFKIQARYFILLFDFWHNPCTVSDSMTNEADTKYAQPTLGGIGVFRPAWCFRQAQRETQEGLMTARAPTIV